MKAFYLDKSFLNVQKCLLPDCEFLNLNYGKYCLCTVHPGCSLIVKIGLCEVKNTKNIIYLDDTVCKYSLKNYEKFNYPENVDFNDLKILKKPIKSKQVEVILVCSDIFKVQKFKNCQQELLEILKEILKYFTFCNNSLLSLKKLGSCQFLGLEILIINSTDILNNNQPFIIDKCTDIIISKIISLLQFQQYEMNKKLGEIGGCNQIHKTLKEAVELSRTSSSSVKFINKLLLIGPNGCGKTTLIKIVANETGCILLEISANSLYVLNSEVEMKNILKKAKLYIANCEPCILLIKNIDMCSQKKNMSKKIFKNLIEFLENVENLSGIMVIATTSSPNDVDLQLRMPKRFENELEITVPSEEERENIISIILKNLKISCDKMLIKKVSKWTPGFVGADLKSLVLEAVLICKKTQMPLQNMNNNLFEDSFRKALTKIIPSELKGAIGLCLTNDITFSEIGGLNEIKKILELEVILQLKHPEKFRKLGVSMTKGLLLYGPPGCAKTILVKALAKEAQTTFLATSAADLYSPYVGDAEKKIIQLFEKARFGSPAIIFIDEIDAIVGSKSGDREHGVQERILSTLLIEMDGIGTRIFAQNNNILNEYSDTENTSDKSEIHKRNNVIVIGATNHPEMLDDALKRPGRFDRLIYISPPSENDRLQILKKLTKRMPLHKTVNLELLAKRTEFYSGADLRNMCQESGLSALSDNETNPEFIYQNHFEKVLSEYKPSLNQKLIDFYESYQNTDKKII